ncbi:ComEC/Rec2 family competence protein [Flavobacterium sp. XS2P24]|uniref:ComEC/Rec2 family competence protein n=1 Tax=Flavobacterium sp. XS2P24 TaxID=3041249 RepID=UPI0024A866E0|nr:ComEC/Rec2 family competence protein [Flavobacterium sp. XS2P24]MDI6049910.1 ComEC/Rec2 family competence protein [Flavobacterium sp. XS2P24]
MKVLHFPLARITIGFISGILFAYYFHPPLSLLLILLSISISVFGMLYFLFKNKSKNVFYFGLTTYLLSFLIGISTQIIHIDHFQKSNYIHNTTIFEKPQSISIIIREKLKSSPFSDRYIVIINHVNEKKQTGKVILNIQKDSLHHQFEIGTPLLIKGILSKNKPPNNPNQFNYSKYLENKQIYAQLYADVDEIKIGTEIEKNIWYYSSKLRTRIIHNLEKNNFNKTELNVALALIMGQQQDISPEIIRDYQYAGAVHILSVSGLHIGFILIFVTFILKPIPNTKRGSFIKLLIILASLFTFGIIAGLAPSVVRSVTMFSFVAIGNHLRRSVNIYHTLLVSILLILLFEPSFLFDVGFQLSYLALFFIIWLQPLLASIWLPKNKVSKYIWDILTVSFAAQLGTLPLSIYYFHQFPGLFFVTNLIIIPVLSIIMVLGVLVMLLAALNSIPIFLSQLLEWSIYYLNKVINVIASLEQFIIQDIPLHFYLLLSSYLLLFTAIIWLKKPSFNRLVMTLVSIIIVQISYLDIQWNIQNEQEWIVFNIKRNTLLAERKGENITVYANDSILKAAQKNDVLKSYRIGNLSSLRGKKVLQNLFYFNGKKIFILDSSGVFPKNMNPDIIVLTQSPKINFERLLQTIKPKMVVADASNYKTIQKQWKATCLKQKIPFHATSEKGYYKLND